MLAYMQPSTPTALSASSPSVAARTAPSMSLAVLPSSPVTYNQPFLAGSVNNGNNSGTSGNINNNANTNNNTTTLSTPTKKPKLSLNTSNLSPVVRKGTTSLRLETLSATSPTIRNTFQNAWSPTHGNPSAQATSQPPPLLPRLNTTLPQTSNDGLQTLQRPGSSSSSSLETPISAVSMDQSSSSAASMSSSSTFDSLLSQEQKPVPYKPTFAVRSALRNSPLLADTRVRQTHKRKLSLAPTAAVFFPAAKKVAFRAPLTEEIITVRYTLRHSDIEVAVEADKGTEEKSADASVAKEGHALTAAASAGAVVEDADAVSDSRAADDLDDPDADPNSCPATPVAGRAKRVLQWRWTIDTSEGANSEEEIGVGED